MNLIFYKLLGIPTDGATRVADGSLGFRGTDHLGWFFLTVMLLGALAVWSYWKTRQSRSGWSFRSARETV